MWKKLKGQERQDRVENTLLIAEEKRKESVEKKGKEMWSNCLTSNFEILHKTKDNRAVHRSKLNICRDNGGHITSDEVKMLKSLAEFLTKPLDHRIDEGFEIVEHFYRVK